MSFGLWLQETRKRKGISGRELSKRIKRSSNYISSLEIGKNHVRFPLNYVQKNLKFMISELENGH